MGVVLLEALASGTPIVCSDIHGYRSVVRRGEQGLLVPPRDVNALADAIGQLLSRSRDARADERVGAPARRPVRLGQHHGQGRGVLPLRDSPRRRPGSPAAAHEPGAHRRAEASHCRSTLSGRRASRGLVTHRWGRRFSSRIGRSGARVGRFDAGWSVGELVVGRRRNVLSPLARMRSCQCRL